MKEREQIRRLTTDAILLSLALVLAVVERWIPLDLLVPIPGLKLGLANIVTLFALIRLSPLDALVILVMRCLILGTFTGLTSLLFSLTGGLLALGVMWVLLRWEGKAFSLIGISVAGAAAHNIGQMGVAVWLLNEPRLFYTYLPPLLLTSLATGTLTGIAALPLVKRFPPIAGSQRHSRGSNRSQVLLPLFPLILVASLTLQGCTPAAGSSLPGASSSPAVSGSDSARDTSAVTPAPSSSPGDWQKFSYAFTGTFDSPIDIIGYAPDQATFDQWAQAAEVRFTELHRLFDVYHSYSGLNNLATINARAGLEPVPVSAELIDLLVQVRGWRQQWSDTVTLTLGPVLKIWEKTRSAATTPKDPSGSPGQNSTVKLPSPAELASALTLVDDTQLIIDETAGTVFLARAGMSLDVGAVAKGYATELVARHLQALGAVSLIINAGGSSVRLIGKPQPASRDTWLVGIENPLFALPMPDGSQPAEVPETCATVAANNTSVVTSGDYQRYFVQDGIIYNHIIDPQTGQPAHFYRGVTIVTPDSGLADFLSTALFVLPPAESRSLAESVPDVEVMWILADGSITNTDGFPIEGGTALATR